MGSCPYCQSVTYTGDTICYSCGRILANTRSNKFAMEQQFNKGSLDTSYKMSKKPAKSGIVQTHTGRSVDLMKNKRNRTRHLVLLFLVAFIMLSPQVRDSVEKWAPGIQEYVLGTFAPYHLYPNEATFTLDRTVVLVNSNSNGWAYEDIVIPTDIEYIMEVEFEDHDRYLIHPGIVYISCQLSLLIYMTKYAMQRNRVLKYIKSIEFINKFLSKIPDEKIHSKTNGKLDVVALNIADSSSTTLDWIILGNILSEHWLDFTIFGISTSDGGLIKKSITFGSAFLFAISFFEL